MFVICKRALLFQKDEIVEDEATKQRVQLVEETFTIYPNQNYTPQPAPDWIKETDLYKLALKDGSLIETAEPKQEESTEQQQHKHGASAKGSTGLTQGEGWNKK